MGKIWLFLKAFMIEKGEFNCELTACSCFVALLGIFKCLQR